MFKLNMIKIARRQKVYTYPHLIVFGLDMSPLCAFSPWYTARKIPVAISEVTLQ